jgi:ATP-binding cassette subfamily B protein
MGSVTLGINFALLGVLGYGGVLVLEQQMSVGDLAAFSLYSLFVGGSATGLATAYGDLMQAAGAADRVFALTTDEKAEAECGEMQKAGFGLLRPEVVRGELQFDDVSFAYPTRPDAPVLLSLSLTVQPGEMVAVVGGSGGGKSTLLALLTALYAADAGSVRFDGHAIAALDTTWLRDQIGVVAQEPVIFGGTIRENIAYGCGRGDTPTEEEIMSAASAANALQFVNALPEGFNTVVGERGVTLSGGQRQRIAIARAIVNSPQVLLLDEATSALDSKSERAVQAALETVVEQRTTLVIAHR